MRSAVAFLLVGLVTGPAAVSADEQVWALLKGGGQVILIRHAITTPGVGDPPGMRLEDCSTQRNLSAGGRDDARRIGDAFRARGIGVDDVRSSIWCRCLDTATLAFGTANPWLPLNSFFRSRDREPAQTRTVREMVSRHRGGTVVFVTHQVNITALTGLFPDEGEMIILTPQGDGFTVAGRLKPSDVSAH